MNGFTEGFLITVDSDRPSYERCLETARQWTADAPDCEEVQGGVWTVEQAEVFHVADDLKDYFETLTDDFKAPESAWCIIATLYRRAFEEIEWREVAEHYLGKVREQANA